MRRLWPLLFFVIIFFLAIVGINTKPITLAPNSQSPTRIISLAPSITETLFALGAGDSVIAVTDYCDYPTETESLAKIGGFINPNLEAIAALQADLIILLSNQSQLIKQLKQLNIPTLAVNNTRLLDIQQAINTIGKVTHREAKAKQLIAEFDQQIAAIQTKITDKKIPKVMITMGHSIGNEGIKTIFIAGQQDFYNDLITLAGGENVYQGTNLKVPSLSIEGIMQLNPEVIIDIFPEADDHKTDLNQAQQRWKNLTYVDAAKNNRVHIIEQDYATIPGPRLILLLKEMAQLIHPDIDWQS